ncbi:MAG TPA: flagellar motor protein MotB, partial [Planctomycetaceae bacterium]|nr:flagellar motor protein MotB [Planctomycetaceae bacterium]
MRMSRHAWISLMGLVAMWTATGCMTTSPQLLRQSQLRAWQLYNQNKTLAMERDQAQQLAQTLQAEKERLARKTRELQTNLEITKKRLENLSAERSKLHQRYVSLLNSKNPMSAESTRRFEDLARRFPEFEFDPETGVSKFTS